MKNWKIQAKRHVSGHINSHSEGIPKFQTVTHEKRRLGVKKLPIQPANSFRRFCFAQNGCTGECWNVSYRPGRVLSATPFSLLGLLVDLVRLCMFLDNEHLQKPPLSGHFLRNSIKNLSSSFTVFIIIIIIYEFWAFWWIWIFFFLWFFCLFLRK